jgi:biopolymer transport protein ExbB
VVGPVAMFASASGDLAGLLQQELNKADPTVVVLDKKIQEGTRALVTTGKGQLALDPTLGNAFKLSALEETLFEKVAKGGWAMIPLLALGAAALIVAVVKWMQLARVPVAADAELQQVLRLLENGDHSRALAFARGIPGRVGDLLATAVENVDAQKEHIEELLYEKMLGARAELERGIAFLALTATTGPLLGLLGTVMGMIATFQAISSFGSGDPKLLAAGISEALICTATGMAVAIPALLSHAFLNRKAKELSATWKRLRSVSLTACRPNATSPPQRKPQRKA